MAYLRDKSSSAVAVHDGVYRHRHRALPKKVGCAVRTPRVMTSGCEIGLVLAVDVGEPGLAECFFGSLKGLRSGRGKRIRCARAVFLDR